MIFYIYALFDPRKPDEIRYVGQTSKGIRERFLDHLKTSGYKTKTSYNTHKGNWIRSLLKDGVTPAYKIIEEANETNWAEHEKFWIADYRAKGHRLTNATDGGEGTIGQIHTEESRRKMSEARKGKILSEEHKRKISIAHSNTSEETRKKLSEANIGRHPSEESRRKMSIAQKAKILTEETKRKISESTRGKVFSEETRKKLSIALIGNKRGLGNKGHLGHKHSEESKKK
jgi:hypothetical protein